MSSSPAVSVVIPAYRVTGYISQALESVLQQTYPAAEIVVVNDGCPEGEALDNVIAAYSFRVMYLKQDNAGPAAARNRGIIASKGELVAFLDADDYWRPDFLERQVSYLVAHPEIDLVYSDALYVADDGTAVGSLMKSSPSKGGATLQALLEGSCTVATSTVVARRARLVAVNLFDEHIGKYSEDFDLWVRIAHSGGRIAYTTEPLAYHRIHPASLTAASLQLPRAAVRVLGRARSHLSLTDLERAALDQRVAAISADILSEEAKQLLLKGEDEAAYQCMLMSAGLKPHLKRRLAALLLRVAPGTVRRLLRWRSRAGAGRGARP